MIGLSVLCGLASFLFGGGKLWVYTQGAAIGLCLLAAALARRGRCRGGWVCFVVLFVFAFQTWLMLGDRYRDIPEYKSETIDVRTFRDSSAGEPWILNCSRFVALKMTR